MSTWIEDLDKAYRECEPKPPGGGGDFEPIPEDERVNAVITKQEYVGEVGEKGTPLVKVTFEVREPEQYKDKKIWHDFWITEKSVPYLKHTLEILGYEQDGVLNLTDNSDVSLLNLGANVTVGVEEYTNKNGEHRKKNVIKFFNKHYDVIPF